MPVLGLQKGQLFSTDVSAFYCKLPTTPRPLLRHRFSAAFSQTGLVTNLIEQNDCLKENIVIAAYGTRLTLHKHPTRKKAKSATEKRRLSMDDQQSPQESNYAAIRRLSLNLNPKFEDYKSHDHDQIKIENYYDLKEIKSVFTPTRSKVARKKDQVYESQITPVNHKLILPTAMFSSRDKEDKRNG